MRLTPWLSLFSKSALRKISSSVRVKRRSWTGIEQVECLEDRLFLSTFYVATTGDNLNVGDITHPFRTVQQALTAAGSDSSGPHTINVAAGTYNQAGLDNGFSIGSSASYVDNLDGLTIDAGWNSNFTTQTFGTTVYLPQTNVDNSSPSPFTQDITIYNNHVTVRGFTFVFDGQLGDGGTRQSGGLLSEGQYTLITQNTVEVGYSNSGVRSVGIVVHTPPPAGISVHNDGTAVGVQVTNNTILANGGSTYLFNNDSTGILVNPETTPGRVTPIIISGNNISGPNLGTGITIDKASYVTVDGNSIQRTGSTAVSQVLIALKHSTGVDTYSSIPQTGIIISNNTLDGLDGSAAGSIGINLSTRNNEIQQVNGVTITGNIVRDLAYGVVGGLTNVLGSGINSTANSFTGITAKALYFTGTGTMNGSANWYGSNVLATVTGLITGTVDYTPYLNLGTDTSGSAGFQPDYSDLTVVGVNGQTGAAGRIQEAIDLQNTQAPPIYTGTVTVTSGTYTEAISGQVGTLNLATGAVANLSGTVNGFLNAGVGTLNALGTGTVGTLVIGDAVNNGGGVTSDGLQFTGAGTLALDVSSVASHDLLDVNGTVALGTTATLSLTVGAFVPVDGAEIILIDNDGAADAVTGTFVGLADGAIVSSNFGGSGKTARITYHGGDGNDVAIRVDKAVVSIPAPTPDGSPDTYQLRVVGSTLETLINGVVVDTRPLAGIQNLTIDGSSDADTLNLDFAGGDPIPLTGLTFNGGAGFDKINLINVGSSFTTQTYNYTNANDGSIVLNDGTNHTITYTGLEPITNDGTPTNIIFNLPDTADATITLADLVAGVTARLDSTVPTFEQTDFAIPAVGGSITINMGATTAQTITVGTLTLNATTDLTIDGQGGTDVIHLNSAGLSVDALTLSAETIDQANAVVATGTTTLTATSAGNITLNSAANNFSTVVVVSGNDVTLVDTNAINLGTSTVTGNLSVTATGLVDFTGAGATTVGGTLGITTTVGGITDSGAGSLAVTGVSTLAAGAGNNITLNNAGDNFSTVVITSGNNVTLVDTNAINLGNSTVSGNLSVTATGLVDFTGAGASTVGGTLGITTTVGGITDTGAGSLAVTGISTLAAGAGNDITLNNAGNNFSTVVITSGNNVTLVDTNAINLGTSTVSGLLSVTATGLVDFTGAGATTVGGTLGITTTVGGITDSGAGTLAVTGTSTLAAGAANNITLNNAGNNFSTVAITNGNTVTLNDVNGIDLGASTISGNLIVTSGAITDSGAVLITGTTSLTAGANPITLDAADDFGGLVTIVSGTAVVLNDINDINFAATGTLTSLAITAATGTITDTGDVTVTNNASFLAATITLGGGGEATNYGSLTFNSAGVVTIQEDSATDLAGSNSANSLSLTSTGAITDSSTSLTVSTQATFSGTAITIGGAGTTTALTDVTFTSAGAVSIQEDSGINLTGANTASTLTLDVSGNITEAGTVTTGTTNLTGAVITMTTANVFGSITVNNGTGAVSITENAQMDIAGIIHNGGLLTLQAGANTINVNGAINITGGNADFLTTGILNLNNNVTATVITGTPTTVNVNNNTAQIQDGVDAALAGATVNVTAASTFSENVGIPKNLNLVATIDNVTISGGVGGAALTVTAGTVSITGFYANTAAPTSTVFIGGGVVTLRNNVIVESSGFTQAAILNAGTLNMGVSGTSTPGNNSISVNGAGSLLTSASPVDASGNYWGTSVFATITAGISSPATVDYTPYLNLGTNLVGIGFQGDFSDLTAHAGGSQLGVAAITEAYNMLTAVGTIHALTGSYTESVDLGAAPNKAVTLAAGASPGQVDISGSLTLTANDTLPIELTGYTPPDATGPTGEGTNFDNFTVHGTVTLGNATLVPTISYAAHPYDRFTIINNLSGGAVVGTFGGQPEGSVINVNGVRLRVSYKEFHQPSSSPSTPSFFGDGDDVSLTVMLPPILVTQGVNGDLTLDGTGWNDDLTLSFTGTNQLTLIGNDVTNFTGPLTSNIQLAGPYTVTGNITIKLGNGNDKVLIRGVGANATYDSGDLTIDLGADDDTITTIDSLIPPTLNAGLKMTGNLSIIGGAGTDNVTLGSVTATDTLLARDVTIDTGTGLAQTISLDRLTATRNVTLTNGGSAAQTVAMGVIAANVITGNLVINQLASASSYTVGLHNTSVGGFLNVTNGSGSGAAAVTIDTTTAQSVNGATTITNGNNLTNAVTIVGTTGGLQLKGSIAIKNGTATNTNGITITDITDSGNSATNLTNGASPANTITFNGALANTFLGLVTATNGASTGTNVINATRLSSTKGINLNNGTATTSNAMTIGGAAATDLVSVTGNLVISNGTAGTTTIGIDRLTTLGANAVGNVTINDQATGAGGTGLTFGANAANSISGNLQITNQSSTGTRSVLMNQTTVSGRTGVNIYEVGTGNTSLTIGNVAASTISKGLVVQDGTGSSTVNLQNLTVGNFNYADLGGGTDTLALADTAGTFRVNGVTRIDTGAGSDTVRIATTGTAILNDTVFIALGAGNDLLFIGPNADSPAFNSASKFMFDGGSGDDTFNASPLSIAEYSGSPLAKKVKSKILNFEHLLTN